MMAQSRSPLLFITGVVAITVTLHSQQVPADQRPQATFKTGIDIVQLDVSVFDKDQRPIRGLTMEDFTVLENGQPQPTVSRHFASADRARAFLRVYQKDRRPVRIGARIVNDANQQVFARTDDLGGEAFASRASADYQVELPVASLAAGQYLLTIEAAAGDTRLMREVRFAVR